MPTTKKSKWTRPKKAICKKFQNELERTREQTEAFWDYLALPKKSPFQSKVKRTKNKKADHYKQACKEVDMRDNHTCLYPGCNCRMTQHHHARFRSQGGQDRKEEIVSLCWKHHTGTNESPHQSEYWRNYWVEWLTLKYPIYWSKIHESQKIRVKGACS